MSLLWWARTVRGEKRYLVGGKGSSFFALLSPKAGWRRFLEQSMFFVSRFPERDHEVVRYITSELGSTPSDFLLYYTGDYKDTDWIGLIRKENALLAFVKLYKEAGLAKQNYECCLLAQQYFSPFFATASPLQYSEHILALGVLHKAHNISIQRVWSRVFIQSLSLYEHRDVSLLAWDLTKEKWIPTKWRYAPRVFAHGDLSHWNCFVDRNGVLCLIDYEEVGWYPPFYDCFHLLLKPTLLHQKSSLPEEECLQIAGMANTDKGQVLVWLYLYLEEENQKDILRNTKLQNQKIAQTIENRKHLQQECMRCVMMLSQEENSEINQRLR